MLTADTYALLAACRRESNEDTPRLALADEIEEAGFAGAAAYIRESIGHYHRPTKEPRRRAAIARDYDRWLGSLFGLPPRQEGVCGFVIGGGEKWSSFHWWDGDNRNVALFVERGLPAKIRISCAMLMERAADIFIFPLTECLVTDRKPERDDIVPDDVQWVWCSRPYPSKWNTWIDDAYALPTPLYKLLPVQKCPGQPRAEMARGHYTSRKHADEALSEAALIFGRAAVKSV